MIESEKLRELVKTIGSEILKDTKDDAMERYEENKEVSPFEMWNLLTALRGPDDSETNEVKQAVTSVIRFAFLSLSVTDQARLNLIRHPQIFDVSPDSIGKLDIRMKIDRGIIKTSNHFVAHAERAFSVLGLRWNVVNVIPLPYGDSPQTQDPSNTPQVPSTPF